MARQKKSDKQTSTDKPFKRMIKMPDGTTRESDAWYIRYEGPEVVDPKTGRLQRKQIMRSCGKMSYKEACAELAKAKLDVANGESAVGSNKMTVAGLIAEYLREAGISIERSTLSTYRITLHKHVTPHIGEILLSKIGQADIQRLVRLWHDQGLAPKTIKNLHSTLRRVFTFGIEKRRLTRNPAEKVLLPKQVAKERACTDAEGLKKIIECAATMGVWRLPVLTACFTGMRRNEILALQWRDFDEEHCTLTARRSIKIEVGVGTYEGGTKTDTIRAITIPPVLRDALAAHHQETPYNSDNDWIFTRPDGRYLQPQRFSENFTRLGIRAGVPIVLHGTRHTQVTLLINAGIPVQDVSARIGHSQTSTTMNIYSHASTAKQQAAADVLGKLLG
jgi:integrase